MTVRLRSGFVLGILIALFASVLGTLSATPARAAVNGQALANSVAFTVPLARDNGGNVRSDVKINQRQLPAGWRAVADVRHYKNGPRGGWVLISGYGTKQGHTATGGFVETSERVHVPQTGFILTQARARVIGPLGANHPYFGPWRNTTGNKAYRPAQPAPQPVRVQDALRVNSKSTPVGCNQNITNAVKNRGGASAKVKIQSGCLGEANYGRAKSPYKMTYHVDKCNRAHSPIATSICGGTGKWERHTWTTARWAPSVGYTTAVMVTFPLDNGALRDKNYAYRITADFDYWQRPVPPLRNLMIRTPGSKTVILKRG